DVVALHRDAEGCPAVMMLDVGVLERLGTSAVNDLVDPVVVLQVVVAGDVVVLGILGAPDQATPLISLAFDRLQLDGEVHVLGVGAVDQGDVEVGARATGGLGQRLARVRLDDLPLAGLVREAPGNGPGLIVVESPGLLGVVPGQQGNGQGPDEDDAGGQSAQTSRHRSSFVKGLATPNTPAFSLPRPRWALSLRPRPGPASPGAVR